MNKKKLSRLLPYIFKYKSMFIISLIFMIFITISKLSGPLILAHIIDKSVHTKNINDLFLWAFFFIIFITIGGILNYFQTIIISKMGIKIVSQLKRDLFEHLLLLPVSYFDKNPVGKLIARVESDSEKVKQLFSTFSIMVLGNILFFTGMLIVLFSKSIFITSIIIIPIPIIMILVFFALKYLKKFYKQIRQIYAQLSALLTEYLQGIYIIQLFNRQEKILDIIKSKSKQKMQYEQKTAFIEYAFWSSYSFIIEILFIILVILLTTPKIFAGVMTIGTLIIFLEYGMRIFEPLLSISESFNLFQRAFVSLERIFNIMDIDREMYISKSIPVKFKKQITFKNVWFSYNNDQWVLKNINFTIEKNSTTAIVGASGSGKSTTINLLMRFYNINKGNIFVDNTNIYDFNLKQWREKTGLVLQDIFLFPGTILENIRIYNDNISEKQVINALEKIHAFNILRSNKGIYTELTERGQNLSVGEKQLISFARALVFDKEIIIMDEATASIDMQTEKNIQNALETLLKEKTAIIIAHRLSSIVNADKIILFQNGEILDQGTHNELMKKSKEYEKFVNLQFLKKEDQ